MSDQRRELWALYLARFASSAGVQGIAMTAAGLTTVATVGELSLADDRANNIGRLNAVRFAGAIAGSAYGGLLFPRFGPAGVSSPHPGLAHIDGSGALRGQA